MSNSDCTPKAIVTRGKAIYQQLKDEVELHYNGKFLAVDIETQDYEIHDKGTVAIIQLLAKYPNAAIYLVRIGHRTAYRAGFRSTYDT